MAIEGKGDGKLGRRLRLGMVGGGQGAFIGAVHRIAARLDDRYELVAGALSSDPERARASAVELRIGPERAYGSYEEMAKVLRVPKGTIMSRLFHARRKMQERLQGYLEGDLEIKD